MGRIDDDDDDARRERRQHWLNHQRFTWPPHLYRAVRDYAFWKMRGNGPLLPMTPRQMFGIRPKAAREKDGSAMSPLHVDVIPAGIVAYCNLAGKTHAGFVRQELMDMQDWSRTYWQKRWEPMKQCGEVMLASLCDMSADEIGLVYPAIPQTYRENPSLLGTPLAGLPFGLLEHPEYVPPAHDDDAAASGGSKGAPPPRPDF